MTHLELHKSESLTLFKFFSVQGLGESFFMFDHKYNSSIMFTELPILHNFGLKKPYYFWINSDCTLEKNRKCDWTISSNVYNTRYLYSSLWPVQWLFLSLLSHIGSQFPKKGPF